MIPKRPEPKHMDKHPGSRLVLMDQKDGVCRLTLNRPHRLNAFIFEMGAELLGALEKIAEDHEAIVREFLKTRAK